MSFVLKIGVSARNAAASALCVLLSVASAAGAQETDLDAVIGGDDPREAAGEAETKSAKPQEENPPAAAEAANRDSAGRRVIEEVVVTAQRTEQRLQDVPISMSVLDDEFIQQQGIGDLEDLSAHVPNANLNANAFWPDLRVRGFGSSGLVVGFEQSVGLVLDGVPYGRQQYFHSALFDVERVEVLRGPQGTLFGKNTTAGLFNVVTKNPTDETTGSIALQLGELGHREVDAAIGGPVVPNLLNFRVAGILDERDGFLRNTTAQVDPKVESPWGARDRKGIRVKLDAPDLFGARVLASYERIDLDLTGVAVEFGIVPENLIPFYESWDPGFDAEPGNYVGSVNQPSGTETSSDTFAMNATYDLGNWGLDAVAGHAVLGVVETGDFDLGPSPMVWSDPRSNDNTQTTFEARLSSPELTGIFGLERLLGFGLGRSSFLLGFFYQRRTLDDGLERVALDTAVVGEFLAAQGSGGALPPISGDVEVSSLFFEQSSDAIAGFGQGRWHFLDRWSLEGGLRISQEDKTGSWQRTFDTGPNPFMAAALAFEEFTAEADRSEFIVTPKVSLRYDWTDDIGLYAGWGKGFKAGGFNTWLTASDDPTRLEFSPERVSSWELGTKGRFLGGAATADLGLFWMEVQDFQERAKSANDLEQFVANVAEARARGVEADLTWLTTDWLALRGTVGFNDSVYLDYPAGACPADREERPGCNLSGEPLNKAPQWSVTVTPSVVLPTTGIPGAGAVSAFLGGAELVSSLNVAYQSSMFVSDFRDPRGVQGGFVRLDGNLGVRDLGQGWSLRFVVKNITNEVVLSRVDDAILSAQVSGGGVYYQFVEPPRLFFGELRWEF